MAAGTWTLYNKAKKKLGNGTITLGVQNFKMLLCQSSSNFATATLSLVGSLTNQCASAGGYVQAGIALTVTWTAGASAGQYRFSMSNMVQTATGANIANIRTAVIKNSAGQLLCYATLTSAQFTLTQTNTLTIAPSATGIFNLA